MQEAMAACSAAAGDALLDERALNPSARQMPGLHLLDFDDAFVDPSGQCPPVSGTVLVYRDIDTPVAFNATLRTSFSANAAALHPCVLVRTYSGNRRGRTPSRPPPASG